MLQNLSKCVLRTEFSVLTGSSIVTRPPCVCMTSTNIASPESSLSVELATSKKGLAGSSPVMRPAGKMFIAIHFSEFSWILVANLKLHPLTFQQILPCEHQGSDPGHELNLLRHWERSESLPHAGLWGHSLRLPSNKGSYTSALRPFDSNPPTKHSHLLESQVNQKSLDHFISKDFLFCYEKCEVCLPALSIASLRCRMKCLVPNARNPWINTKCKS